VIDFLGSVLSDMDMVALITITTCRMRIGIPVSVGRVRLAVFGAVLQFTHVLVIRNRHPLWSYTDELLIIPFTAAATSYRNITHGHDDGLDKISDRGSSGLLRQPGDLRENVRENRSTEDH
jgi:hypothetical protein